jgi:hypothetical protein
MDSPSPSEIYLAFRPKSEIYHRRANQRHQKKQTMPLRNRTNSRTSPSETAQTKPPRIPPDEKLGTTRVKAKSMAPITSGSGSGRNSMSCSICASRPPHPPALREPADSSMCCRFLLGQALIYPNLGAARRRREGGRAGRTRRGTSSEQEGEAGNGGEAGGRERDPLVSGSRCINQWRRVWAEVSVDKPVRPCEPQVHEHLGLDRFFFGKKTWFNLPVVQIL